MQKESQGQLRRLGEPTVLALLAAEGLCVAQKLRLGGGKGRVGAVGEHRGFQQLPARKIQRCEEQAWC